jgi:hypothetical protein
VYCRLFWNDITTENGRHQIDQCIREESDEDGDDVPLDDVLGLACLLRVASGEDIVVARDDEGDTRDDRQYEEEKTCYRVQEK